MKPLYIWAGGKSKMIPKYLESPNIPRSGYDTFVEPFFGGGAMTIWIYKNCPNVKRFIINDVKYELIWIYQAIKNDVKKFTDRMDELSKDYLPLEKKERKEFYYSLRSDYINHNDRWTYTVESATLYFLMKTAFNGIWQTTKDSKGKFATPCGLLNQKDKVYDLDNVMEWHKFLQLAELYIGDWELACRNKSKSFFFFDPPYRDSFTSYGEGFTDDDHAKLMKFCNDKDKEGHTIFYCNRDDANDGFFEKHQGNLARRNYDIKYTAGRRKTNDDGTKSAKAAKEILLYSSRLEPATIYLE